VEPARRSPGAAFFLSLVPGAGHVYAGRMGGGALWLLGIVFAYRVGLPFGLLAHFVCAVNAARAALDANREEAAELASRREKASEVADLLDAAAASHGVPSPAAHAALPGPPADPPPRVMRAAFPVPPAALVDALAEGMRARGVLVLGLDRAHLRVRGSVDLGAGRSTVVAAQVEATPAGSRVRLLVDRPDGSGGGAEVDDAFLRGILEAAEAALGGAPRGAGAASPAGAGEALTEDHFFEQLREAWEAREQGWLPEEEWTARKASLVRSVVLRSGTRAQDFLAACRPLVEAEVLTAADVVGIAAALGGTGKQP
jgi:hypothetical protein